MLGEIWRILTPGGRMLAIAPRRAGLWAQLDTTPFGNGQPFSRSQLRDLMRESLFSPTHWGEALYFAPFEGKIVLRSAPLFEKIGAKPRFPALASFSSMREAALPADRRAALVPALQPLQPVLGTRPAGIAPG